MSRVCSMLNNMFKMYNMPKDYDMSYSNYHFIDIVEKLMMLSTCSL